MASIKVKALNGHLRLGSGSFGLGNTKSTGSFYLNSTHGHMPHIRLFSHSSTKSYEGK
jgi:hypothetical protein